MYKRSFASLALAIAVTVPAIAGTPPSVLDPNDPALRLWMRADTLVTDGLADGDPVMQWVDQSQYGTILAPRETSFDGGALAGGGGNPGVPVEEAPHLQYVDINGNNTPTVRFDVDGPFGPDTWDRLYQTNNLAPDFDPTNIGDGSDLTSIIVFKPDRTGETGSPFYGIGQYFGKRGNTDSLYGMWIEMRGNEANFGQFINFDYGAPTMGTSRHPLQEKWHITSFQIDDVAGGADPVTWLDDQSEDPAERMVDVTGVANAFGTRSASETGPFGIGGNAHTCCGETEAFEGNLAELIIFARQLSPSELADVEDYLNAKYFVPEPTSVALMVLGVVGLGLNHRRR